MSAGRTHMGRSPHQPRPLCPGPATAVMPGTKLQEHSGNDKAWVWSTVDFAEESQKIELFAVRFGTVESERAGGGGGGGEEAGGVQQVLHHVAFTLAASDCMDRGWLASPYASAATDAWHA